MTKKQVKREMKQVKSEICSFGNKFCNFEFSRELKIR